MRLKMTGQAPAPQQAGLSLRGAPGMRLAAGWIAVLGVLLAGCGGGSDPSDTLARLNGTNLQRLATLYQSYQLQNGWQGPSDEDTFRAFIADYNPKKLERIGVDPAAIDELFVSQRDGEPFRVRYGVPGSSRGSQAPVIFESVGVEEKRRIGFLDATHDDFDAAEYDSLWGPRPAR